MTIHTGTSGNDIFTITTPSQIVAGDTYDGSAGVGEMVFNTSSTTLFDLTALTLIGIATIDSGYNTVILTPAQIAATKTLLGLFRIKGTGPVSLAGKTLGTNSGQLLVTMDAAGGTLDASGATVLPGVAFNILGGSNGGNTITGTAGADYINTYGKGDTIRTGDGNDAVRIIVTGSLAGNVYDGGAGTNALYFDNRASGPINLSTVNFTNFQNIYVGLGEEVDLTRAEMASVSAIGGGTFQLLDGGNVTLSGSTYAAFGQLTSSATIGLSAAGNVLDLRNYQGLLYVNGGAGNDTVYCPTNGTAYVAAGDGTNLIVTGNDSVYQSFSGGNGVTTLQMPGNESSYSLFEGVSLNQNSYLTTALGGQIAFVKIPVLVFADHTIDLRANRIAFVGAEKQLVFNAGQILDLSGTGTGVDGVFGSNGTINLSAAQASVSGSSNTINFDASAGNAVTITDTAGKADIVNAAGGKITVTASQAAVVGGGNTILGTGGSHIDISQTLAKWDTIGGVGETIVAHHAHIALTGGGNFIRAMGGSTISLAPTKKANTIKGDAATVLMHGATALVNGNKEQIYLYGSNTLQLIGSGDQLFVEQKLGNDSIAGFGASDSMHIAAGIFANYAALLGATRQSGSDTLITLDAHDTITLKNVTATSLNSSQFAFG